MKSLKYYITILVTVMIWGSSWPISKTLVSGSDPLLVSFGRNFVAMLAFSTILVIKRNSLDFSKLTVYWKELTLMGLFGVAGYSLLFLFGLTFTTSAQGSIIVGIGPAFVAVFAAIINKERIEDTRKYIGLLISFLGVVLIIGVSIFYNYQPSYTIGNLMITFGVALWALYSVIAKRVMKEIEPLVVMGVTGIIGTFFLSIPAIILGVISPSAFTPTLIMGVVWLGVVSSFIASTLYGMSIKVLGSTKSSVFVNMVPIFGVLFSFLLLGESITLNFYLGLLLILTGILLMNTNLDIMKIRIGQTFASLKPYLSPVADLTNPNVSR